MIDCGIAFNKMKDELYKCQYLLITHDHKDHVKPEVLKHIAAEFPNIKIYSTYKVRLDNGLELEFDNDGLLTDIDD